MALESHLEVLQQKHEKIEKRIHEMLNHPSSDELEIADLKRHKLKLKDEISKLSQSQTQH